MKKFLSLLMALLMFATVFCTTPTVLADEIDYILVNENSGKVYWESFTWVDDSKTAAGVVKVGDWYYQYYKNKEKQSITVSVCGYDGNETEIEIPTQLDGIGIKHLNEFYLISKTVKTVKIPQEITVINKDIPGESLDYIMEEGHYYGNSHQPIIRCADDGQLSEIIVDRKNTRFSSLDGVLFTKNQVRLLYYPHYKADQKYIVPDSVQYITRGAFAGAKKLKLLTITPNVLELGYDSIPQKGIDELRFENTHLPVYGFSSADPEDWEEEYPRYIPDVPNTVVYCVENSNLYKEYKESLTEPIAMCKELKSLSLDNTETLKKDTDGKWYYYCGNYKIKKTTLVKYKGKWFYIKNGVWDKTVSNVLCGYKGKWFYIKNGKWDKKANGLMVVGHDGWSKPEWTYIVNGKKSDVPKDLVKYNNKWFYIVNGYWYGLYTYTEFDTDSAINTLFKKNGKWFAIVKGKWYKGETIIKYSDKKFYVNRGFVQFGYSGKVKVDGKTYKIKNGKVA